MMQRNISIDVLKLVLSFFVVGLHLHLFEEVNKNVAFFLNQGVFRIAVPIFLVINGYYFSNIQSSEQYFKWVKRIIFLYVFWMLIYAPLWVTGNINLIIVTIFKGYFHLWYIVGLLFASPLLFLFRNMNIKSLMIICLSSYAIGISLQYGHAFHLIDVPNFFYRNFLFFCLPFMMMGFIIRKLEYDQIIKRFPFIYFLISIVIFSVEAFFNLRYSDHSVAFDLYISFVFLCPLLFLFCKQYTISSPLKSVALTSSAIYFIHPLVFKTIQHYQNLNSILLSILTILISLILALPLILLNRKIKIL